MRKQPKTYQERKQAAFAQGLQASKEGRRLSDCPILKHQGLRRSWEEGWKSAAQEREKQSSGMFILRPQPTAPTAALPA